MTHQGKTPTSLFKPLFHNIFLHRPLRQGGHPLLEGSFKCPVNRPNWKLSIALGKAQIAKQQAKKNRPLWGRFVIVCISGDAEAIFLLDWVCLLGPPRSPALCAVCECPKYSRLHQPCAWGLSLGCKPVPGGWRRLRRQCPKPGHGACKGLHMSHKAPPPVPPGTPPRTGAITGQIALRRARSQQPTPPAAPPPPAPTPRAQRGQITIPHAPRVRLAQAQAMVRALDFAGAEVVLRELLQTEPLLPGAQHSLATVLYRTHRWVEAEALWRAVCEALPDDPHALNGHAAALVSCERYADARATLEGLLKRWPDFEPARLNLASLLRQNYQRPRLALSVLAPALATNPGNPDLHFAIGRAKLDLLDPEGALQCLPAGAGHRPLPLQGLERQPVLRPLPARARPGRRAPTGRAPRAPAARQSRLATAPRLKATGRAPARGHGLRRPDRPPRGLLPGVGAAGPAPAAGGRVRLRQRGQDRRRHAPTAETHPHLADRGGAHRHPARPADARRPA